jgi:cysteine desulfurase
MTTHRVYLDWNATTPPRPEVIEAMGEVMRTAWANPASVHGDGRAARRHLEDARSAVARLFGYDGRDVVLTSGGTESNNLALRSRFSRGEGGVLVTSRAEHPSVVRVAEALSAEGRCDVVWLGLDPGGVVRLGDLERALERGGVRLVALQAVNQETGAVQPVAEAIARAHLAGAAVHVDAVQAVGRVALDFVFGADTIAVAAHKARGPKGIGALATKPGVKLHPYVFGGSQERGVRPGTVDPVAAAGLAVALDLAVSGPSRYAAIAELRDGLEARLAPYAERPPALRPPARAPHVTSLLFPGWEGPELVAALDLEGVSVSSGSACSAGTAEPSPVVAALMGETSRAREAVRVSMGEDTTRADVDRAVEAFVRVLSRGP